MAETFRKYPHKIKEDALTRRQERRLKQDLKDPAHNVVPVAKVMSPLKSLVKIFGINNIA